MRRRLSENIEMFNYVKSSDWYCLLHICICNYITKIHKFKNKLKKCESDKDINGYKIQFYELKTHITPRNSKIQLDYEKIMMFLSNKFNGKICYYSWVSIYE